jgi:hypothetical protein
MAARIIGRRPGESAPPGNGQPPRPVEGQGQVAHALEAAIDIGGDTVMPADFGERRATDPLHMVLATPKPIVAVQVVEAHDGFER